jgi:uncharacterized protein YodC (DUF2158 family)
MFMPGMLVRLPKQRRVMVVTNATADRICCSWYEQNRLKSEVFKAEQLVIIDAGSNHLSYT